MKIAIRNTAGSSAAIILATVVGLVACGGSSGKSGGSGSDSSAGSADKFTYGVKAADVAAAFGCSGTKADTQAAPPGVKFAEAIDCTISGQSATIITFASAADERGADATFTAVVTTANAGTQETVLQGTGWWVALSNSPQSPAAQQSTLGDVSAKIGGTIKTYRSTATPDTTAANPSTGASALPNLNNKQFGYGAKATDVATAFTCASPMPFTKLPDLKAADALTCTYDGVALLVATFTDSSQYAQGVSTVQQHALQPKQGSAVAQAGTWLVANDIDDMAPGVSWDTQKQVVQDISNAFGVSFGANDPQS